MKRHSSLAILSREHHGALILAQLLKRNAPLYKGLPADTAGKAEYAYRFYRDELVDHFAAEEQAVLNKVKGIAAPLDALADEIIADHLRLRALFESIKNAKDLAAHLDELGNALEKHIRKEERELFPLIEASCPESVLIEMEQSLLKMQ